MGVSLTELGKSNHHKHLLYSRFPKDNSAKLQSKRLKIFLLSGNFLTIQPGFATDPLCPTSCRKALEQDIGRRAFYSFSHRLTWRGSTPIASASLDLIKCGNLLSNKSNSSLLVSCGVVLVEPIISVSIRSWDACE